MDLTRRPAGKWIVDFGWTMSEADAALYEEPFRWVQGTRLSNAPGESARSRREYWYRHATTKTHVASARWLVALHRHAALSPSTGCSSGATRASVPDKQLIVIARDDDTTFGILHSRFHEAWSLRLCTWLGKGNDPRYTPTTTFETFPFPDGLTPNTPCRRLCRRPARRRHCRGRPAAGRAARPVAQSTRMGRVAGRAGSRLSDTSGASRRDRRNRAQDAHADEPLQRSPDMARRRARGPRRCRCHRLRLAGRHLQRRRARRTTGAQLGEWSLKNEPTEAVDWSCAASVPMPSRPPIERSRMSFARSVEDQVTPASCSPDYRTQRATADEEAGPTLRPSETALAVAVFGTSRQARGRSRPAQAVHHLCRYPSHGRRRGSS